MGTTVTKHTELWIDALDFTNQGGWKEDTQYVHLMGSGYLMAADEPGVPVEDATVTVHVPETGMYRVWVRDRNWLRLHSPGKFAVLVDGKETGNTLGQLPSDKWLWEIAGDVELTAGEHTVSLHDLTGYFARCASIILTTDMDYLPSREIDRIHADRARMKGMAPGIKEGGHFDFIVVGGGPGGVPAAIAAARKGLKVLIIQNRPMLGGNGSTEIGITFDGATNNHVYARESGIAEELRRLRDRDPSFRGDWTRALDILVQAEPNITVLCDNHVYAAEMASPSEIKGVYAMNIRTMEKSHFTAKLFIDCTGDAWLGYYAGAKMRFGREAAWQHDESIAPDVADTITMSGCIKSGNRPFFFPTEEPVEYHAPEWVPQLPKDDREFGRVIKGTGANLNWWLEAPNTYDDMWDGEESRDALLVVLLGYYDHVKNYWAKKERMAKQRLRFVSIVDGRREARRMVGDYILTQDDVVSGRRFEDAVSYSGWPIDIHHPEGIYSGPKGPLHVAVGVPMPTIPYRALYSANIDNLFMAGRNISVTHAALGTVRVQNTIAALGQAAGTAAAMCLRLNETPRGIYERHMKQLQQQLIKDDMFIPGLKNEDEGDPCLTAKASASSVCTTEIFNDKHGIATEPHPLDVARIGVAKFDTAKGDITAVWAYLHSDNDEPTVIHAGAYPQGDVDSIAPQVEDSYGQGVVPAKYEGWVKIDIHVPIEFTPHHPTGNLRFWIEAAEGISWRHLTSLSFYNTCGQRAENGRWKMVANENYALTVVEPKNQLANCAPENVINGISRIRSAEVYEWVSDPAQAMPQWLQLDFAKTTEINSVSVVFNTDLTNPGTCWHLKIPAVPLCVKDYFVEVFADGKWIKVADVTDNFMRKRIHNFDTVAAEKVRVTVTATNGDPSARITEVRASLED